MKIGALLCLLGVLFLVSPVNADVTLQRYRAVSIPVKHTVHNWTFRAVLASA